MAIRFGDKAPNTQEELTRRREIHHWLRSGTHALRLALLAAALAGIALLGAAPASNAASASSAAPASATNIVDVPCGQQVGLGGTGSGSDSNTTYRLQPCTYPFIYIVGTGVVVEGNGALIAPGDSTPAVFGGNITLRDLRISGSTYGGGLRVASGSITLERVVISGNTSNLEVFGGGISAVEDTVSSLTLIDSTISDNVAPRGGGIQVSMHGTHNNTAIRIVRSTISGNRAVRTSSISSGLGGGLYMISAYRQTTLEVLNSTFSGNIADLYGGGMMLEGQSAPSISDTTITNNNAGIQGGGIYDNAGGVPDPGVHLRRSIIAGNTPQSCGGTYSDFRTDYGYNVVTTDCIGGTPAEPTTKVVTSNGAKLGALADNGGPTKTHRPLEGSPAIDSIPSGSAGCTAGAIDQRGVSRPQLNGCDSGAVEVADSTPPTITLNVEGTLGNNGWYTSDVNVNWSVADDESPISAQTGCASSSVTSDTTGITFTCSATSGGGIRTQSVTIKRDTTDPTVRFGSRTPANSYGWNNTNVTVNWQCTDATSGVVSASGSQTRTSEGANLFVTGVCVDKAGNRASRTLGGINIDKTAPTLAPVVSPNPLLLNSTGTVTSNAADALSGIAGASCGPLNTTSVGSKTVTCTASDKAGNSASASASYQVRYNFTGFFAPVSNPPALNVVGTSAPLQLKFSLGGNRGLDILAANSPASQPINCTTLAPSGGYQATSPIGRSGLQYNSGTKRYTYTWTANTAWRGTCRQFSLTLKDGATYSANFKLQ